MTRTAGPRVASLPVPPHLPERVREDWLALVTRPDPAERFDPAAVNPLPGPARRWLLHAIAPGTPLRTAAELALHGRIRLGRWREYSASQALAAYEGYVWASTTRLLGGTVTGFDRLTQGGGEMRHLWRGHVPVMIASGPELARSAAGRLAAELPLVPAAALSPSVVWRPVSDSEVLASVPLAGRRHDLHLVVEPSGVLREVSLLRWAKRGRTWGERLFRASFEGEVSFDGFTLPRVTTGGYDDGRGPRSAFIRQEIDRAVFR